MSWDGISERRRFRRARIDLQVEFADRGGKRSTLQLRTLNLSAGGFYCRVNRRIEPLTRLELGFVFPPFGRDETQARSIECSAIVVRCEPEADAGGGYRLGVCFTQMGAEDRGYVDRYVAWHAEVFGTGEMDGAGTEDERREIA